MAKGREGVEKRERVEGEGEREREGRGVEWRESKVGGEVGEGGEKSGGRSAG